MPTYAYKCQDCEEIIEKFFTNYSSRSKFVDCECGGGAVPTIAPLENRTSAPKLKIKEFKGLSLHDFQCTRCGEIFDDIIDHGEGEDPNDGADCISCGSHSKWLITPTNIDRSSEQFPYFDRGLGRWIMNKQERRDICKNPRRFGIDEDELVPVEGDWNEEDYLKSNDREDAEDGRVYDEYVDRLENSPEFSEYRRAKDMGGA